MGGCEPAGKFVGTGSVFWSYSGSNCRTARRDKHPCSSSTRVLQTYRCDAWERRVIILWPSGIRVLPFHNLDEMAMVTGCDMSVCSTEDGCCSCRKGDELVDHARQRYMFYNRGLTDNQDDVEEN